MTKEALSDYVFTAKYARYDPEKGRRETYDEAVERMFAMHRRKFPERLADLSELEQLVKDRVILGSQRALQFGGPPVEKCHARGYNCSFSYADRPRFFQEALWLLLCGCGVGFSVQFHHVAKLPPLRRPEGSPWTFVVPDTIEGWADALGCLVNSYFDGTGPVSFDYREVRPEGSPLSSGTGRAPGPQPLADALEEVRRLLDRCAPGRLRPIDAYDVVMHAAGAVLSGGIRRSATIALFSPGDLAMATAKTGDWMRTNPQRKNANNSALLIRGSTDFEVYSDLIASAREFGEPGVVWTDSTEHGTNPCGEVGFYPVDEQTGQTGWQFCNLSTVNVPACRNEQEFLAAAAAASRLGTYQAAYTTFRYLGEVSERITRREALLGVSLTGIQDNPDLGLDEDLLRLAAAEVVAANEEVAEAIGINPAARTTCVKPEGTASCLLGTASGIHPQHAKRYLRRVQANRLEPPAQLFAEVNPLAVEASAWGARDNVLTFCCEAPEGASTAGDVSALELLRDVRLVKEAWVDAGKVPERCVDARVSHNVSNTIYVRPEQWGAVAAYIYEYRRAFAGVSLLAASGDLDYPQAPFVEVPDAGEIVATYGPGALLASGLIVDGLRAFGELWLAVDAMEDGRLGLWAGVPTPEQADVIRRGKQFAGRYFAGNVHEMGQCLKHVHNAKLWEDLTREFRRVDYASLAEDGSAVAPMALAACAGGACELK